MRKVFLVLLTVCSFTAFSQDTAKTVKRERKVYNEVGINASLLLRQVFGSSSSSVTPLPYDLTYKLIVGKWASRIGFGINIKNSNTQSYTENQYAFYSAPDPNLPSYNNSKNYYLRIGEEYRFRISKKLMIYTGIDVVWQSLNSSSQSLYIENNLPNSYDYQRDRNTTKSTGVGIGPVVGIQFYCTRRLSIFTEIPFYYMTTSQNSQTNNYENTLYTNTATPYYNQTNNGSRYTTNTSAFSITIPATIYLAFKF